MSISTTPPPLPILSAASRPDEEQWPRQLARRALSLELVRLRHGQYADAEAWAALDGVTRYRARLAAVSATAKAVPTFAGESAAILWGLPLPSVPSEVFVAVPRGTGRRSSNGVVRRVRLLDGLPCTWIGGAAVTDKVETALTVALGQPIHWAIAILDRLLNSEPLPAEDRKGRVVLPDELQSAADLLTSGAQRRKADKLLAFADGRAMSPGESISRVRMAQLGFPAPELQHRFQDRLGHVADTDFYWPDVGLVGEFDGRVKYMKSEYLRGRTPSEVVIAEKEREDRLRALGLRVVRWTWETASQSAGLAAVLAQAGLPRAGPASAAAGQRALPYAAA
ncbi:hypothetical protein KIH31_06925 [Paenarthrobacter sp. DKR-5]|uniref:hypothetical protein n=1 Tax=Paenarthrobacter sp. DKR-5 TaxID=2835535 RepID=UPI001BDD3522|nr:hypothetical protein [Paenarthrobacter sp. DKR-5]MBT1002332.1 hypothetical protein [Paenarthrobacter sp. DKR-5]